MVIGPCPLVFAIVVVDVGETLLYGIDGVEGTALDVVDQPLLLRGRQKQSREVVPVAKANLGRRWRKRRVTLELALEHGTHVDAKGNVVVFDALLKRRGIDDVFMEIIARHVFTRCITQVFQNLLALDDFSH